MAKYFKFQLNVPDDRLLTDYWQRMRGGDNIYAVHWLYNRTGDPELLKLVEKLHRRTADWRMPDDLPNWHNVNIAECFREPAQYFLQTGKESDLQFAYANFREIRKRYGQVPGGMFGGDENCRPGYTDPRQATETCGLIEQMFSDEMMLHITGDTFWADHCEEVAFNMYPAAVMPDFKSLRYLTAPNMAVSDSKNHHPGFDNRGPFLMMNHADGQSPTDSGMDSGPIWTLRSAASQSGILNSARANGLADSHGRGPVAHRVFSDRQSQSDREPLGAAEVIHAAYPAGTATRRRFGAW
jgi:hypothetical protein